MPRGFAGGQGKRPGGPRGLLPLCFRVSRVEPQAATRSSRSSWISAERRIVSYHEHDHQVDLIADMAVASFGFEMIYEREGSGFRARGRDLWVFARQAGGWLACWRTMLDLHEEPASA